ncbi:MAG: TOBE domain-containing protein [Chloroflexi bacterium]|nr:TOBE domain-containing protein [Chloroflexota bacterium]MCL5108014.1 TOBE domain-containing protein [Chloroflexota bacterium]
MESKDSDQQAQGPRTWQLPVAERSSHARIVSLPNEPRCLDAVQLSQLEQSFRGWAERSPRSDVGLSRKRILLIFLLIRYTGAKLNEVLALDPFRDIDYGRQAVVFGREGSGNDRPPREVQIPEALAREIQAALADAAFKESLRSLFRVDPGHVRRKFYERATACGFPQELGAPDAIRRSRAVELLQDNVPLPVVQRILGHSTPNLTASFVEFSEEDMREVARLQVEKESRRKTSARNTFFGKIRTIQPGDIQSRVEVVTLAGDLVTTVITTDSLARLGLRVGSLITAEVKAPWVILEKVDEEPRCTAENRLRGTVARVNHGDVITEYVVRIADGSELCSLVTSESSRRLGLREGDLVWAIFSGFSVVLHTD